MNAEFKDELFVSKDVAEENCADLYKFEDGIKDTIARKPNDYSRIPTSNHPYKLEILFRVTRVEVENA